MRSIPASLARPLQHGVEIRRKILVIEVRVRVDERHENRLEMMLKLRLRIAMLNTKEISAVRQRQPPNALRTDTATSEVWLVMPMVNE